MELGSNFDLDITSLKSVCYNTKKYLQNDYAIYMDSGRSAIRLLTSKLPKGKILLPAYICKSVVDCFADDFEIQYYKLNQHLQIDLSDLASKLDETVAVIYVMHYFGRLQDEETLNFIKREKGKFHYIVIEDTTHCFLTCKHGVGDYQICSLRKWFSIPNGGVLYSKDNCLPEGEIRTDETYSGMVTEAMILKNLYIHNGIDCNAIYRRIFEDWEVTLDYRKDVYKISEMSSVLLDCFDMDDISRRRKENWNYLYHELRKIDIVPIYDKLADDFVPFSFPIFVEKRDEFRKYLIQHHIYCAVHWPMETEEQIHIELNQWLTDHIISLPIDQRYTPQELQYMVKVIKEYSNASGFELLKNI